MKFLRKNVGLVVVLALIIGIFACARLSNMVHFVATGSMVPTFQIHTIVVDTPTHDVKVGDAITFQSADMPESRTHRLIQINKDGSLVTKGDANPSADKPDVPLQKSDVIGKVWFQVPILVPSFWLSLRGILVAAAILGAFALYITKEDKESEKEDDQSDKERELAHT